MRMMWLDMQNMYIAYTKWQFSGVITNIEASSILKTFCRVKLEEQAKYLDRSANLEVREARVKGVLLLCKLFTEIWFIYIMIIPCDISDLLLYNIQIFVCFRGWEEVVWWASWYSGSERWIERKENKSQWTRGIHCFVLLDITVIFSV